MKSGEISVSLRADPLSIAAAVEFVRDERAGAIDVFVGTTRRFTGDRETVSLSYEAYETMAVAELERLAIRAGESWPIVRVAIQHRTGVVAPTEASVVIAVSCAHRNDAFEACRFLIDRLKADVPIWKRERFADGSEEWVNAGG